jgi:hypothetical protein
VIFGLPLDAWVLLFVAVGLGLGLELAFVRARRREGRGAGRPVEGSSVGAQREASRESDP